ncbi:MAG TPA: hypothetical protein VJ717_05915 [Gemmatimonadaceae bacterium]|nr:hypothetical protein [Gemmatimonadaceae bacterium]
MTRLLRMGAGAAMLVIAALAVTLRPTSGWADSPLCKPTGCPSGTQLCATVTGGIPGVGAVTYYCYQPTPGGSPPKT